MHRGGGSRSSANAITKSYSRFTGGISLQRGHLIKPRTPRGSRIQEYKQHIFIKFVSSGDVSLGVSQEHSMFVFWVSQGLPQGNTRRGWTYINYQLCCVDAMFFWLPSSHAEVMLNNFISEIQLRANRNARTVRRFIRFLVQWRTIIYIPSWDS